MTKSRKRILLSSIAMLLVALVALGSATFAWFTINKNVYANTMKVRAVTTAGLQITNLQARSDDAAWTREVSYADSITTLKPVSYALTATNGSAGMPSGYYPADVNKSGGGKWATADDSKFGSWATAPALPSGHASTEDTYEFNQNGYVASYEMYVRSSGDAISKQVTANITTAAITNNKNANVFAKAALCDASGNVVAFYTDGQAYKAIDAISPVSETDGLAATSNATVLDAVPAKNGTAAKFTLYVWFEGNDAECDDSHQDWDCNFTVQFTLTDTPSAGS